MDFFTEDHRDLGEEMGLEQEGETDPAKARSVSLGPACHSPSLRHGRRWYVPSSELLERANVSAIVRRLLDEGGSVAATHRKTCEAIRTNDTHGQGSQILLSLDLFRPTDPASTGSVSPYRSCLHRICFALPALDPFPLRDLCDLL
jgi:hypothetical protein